MLTSARRAWTVVAWRGRNQLVKMATVTPIFVALALLGCVIPLRADNNEEIPFIQCTSSADCPPDYCCLLGPTRFSIPQCRPLQAEGESCRVNAEMVRNRTLVYPNLSELHLTEAHYILCPCAHGTFCDPRAGVCTDNGQSENNRVITENEQD